jgi:hypothetical protein
LDVATAVTEPAGTPAQQEAASFEQPGLQEKIYVEVWHQWAVMRTSCNRAVL